LGFEMLIIVFGSIVAVLVMAIGRLVGHLLEVLQPLFVIGDELLVIEESILDFLQLIRICPQLLVKNGLDVLVILLHYVFVVELLLYLLDALHVCVDDLAVLVAIAEWYVVAPAYLMELEEEIQNVERMQHVDEGKADGALGFEVHG